MSHIAVDLKVIEVKAPAVARAAGVDPDRVLGGLVRLWHRCWSVKSDFVTAIDLAGVFGRDGIALLANVLEAFELLAPAEGGWRVRGADRYLRIHAGRVAGGKKAAGNLKRGRKPGNSRKTAGDGTGTQPPLLPGLSPSTEHRAPSTKRIPPAGDAPNPRHTPLVKALGDAYRGVMGADYGWQSRDFAEVTRLLALCPDNEGIAFRFGWALEKSRDKFHTPKVHRLADLVEHWNAYPAAPPPTEPGFEPIEGGLI